MKRSVFLLFVLVAFILAACAPAMRPALSAQFVALPSEGQLLIAALISAAVTWLAVQAGKLAGFDFTSLIAPIVALIVPALVTLVQSGLGMIPDMWAEPINAFVHFLVVLAASLGIYISSAKVKAKQVRGLLA